MTKRFLLSLIVAGGIFIGLSACGIDKGCADTIGPTAKTITYIPVIFPHHDFSTKGGC